jgi:hypothetical protein
MTEGHPGEEPVYTGGTSEDQESLGQPTPVEDPKIYACDWRGKRGGRWWTGWTTYAKAEEKFNKIGETLPAKIVKRIGNEKSLFQMSKIIMENNRIRLDFAEQSLKEMLKRRKRLDKTIEFNRQSIREYRKKIKESICTKEKKGGNDNVKNVSTEQTGKI